MSNKRPTEPGAGADDWSRDAGALFRAARTAHDHAPTAADRARVRDALARRLAQTSSAPETGDGAQAASVGMSTRPAAFGKLAKLGLGIVCVTAGAFAFIRSGDSHRLAAPKAASVAVVAGSTNSPERALNTALPVAGAATAVAREAAADDAPATHAAATRPRLAATKATARARPTAVPKPRLTAAQRAALERELVASKHAAATTDLAREAASRVDAQSSPAAAAHVGAPPSPAAAPGAAVEPSSAAIARSTNQASDAAASRASARPSPPSPPPRVPVSDAASPATPPPEASSDVRAELAFVARIQAAMLEAKPRSVLALCAEHERRWPHGTFVQEREGLRTIALCSSRALGADTRAQAFFARYPRAAITPRVRDACAAQRAPTGKAESSRQLETTEPN